MGPIGAAVDSSSRLLSARLLTLSGVGRASARLVVASQQAALAETACDPHGYLTARAWRIVSLLEEREVPAVDVEIETVSELAERLVEPALLRALDVLQALRPLFLREPDAEGARRSFVRLVAEALQEPPPSPMSDAALGLLSDAAVALADAGVAEVVHVLVLHWMGRPLQPSFDDEWTVARSLAALSAATGRSDDLEHWLDEALKHAATAPEAELLALTRHGAAVLLAGGRREHALTLLDLALRSYRPLGPGPDQDRAEALARELAGERFSAPASAVRGRLVCCGEYWSLEYAGESIHLRDSKGLRDLRCLLARPGSPVSTLELMAASQGEPPVFAAAHRSPRSLSAEGLEDWRPCASATSDPRALQEYAASATELRQELRDAEDARDLGRAEQIRADLELLESELLGGGLFTARDCGAPSEKARKAVSKRIRAEIRTIAAHHAALGRHLGESIHTGSVCCYSPHELVHWSFDLESVDGAT